MYKIKFWSCLVIIATSALFAISVSAQPSSGGTFTIIQSAVADGGGRSTGGAFRLEGTIGQALAGTQSSGGTFNLAGGFHQPFLTPTAAAVSISGRVQTSNGNVIPRAIVTLTEQNGLVRTATVNQFGYFRFNGIEAGQVVILNGFSKGFEFSPQILTVSENIDKIILTPAFSKSIK